MPGSMRSASSTRSSHLPCCVIHQPITRLLRGHALPLRRAAVVAGRPGAFPGMRLLTQLATAPAPGSASGHMDRRDGNGHGARHGNRCRARRRCAGPGPIHQIGRPRGSFC
jgi:hypothetical protein